MKRRNVQLAFMGEGSPRSDDVDQLVDGDEAVSIEVKSGKVMVLVPAGTADESLFDQASLVGGELVLENGKRLSFEIHDAAEGAQYSATPVGDQADTHVGLSGIPNVPGGT